MKKIGLFLEAVPFSGGTFQYNISILEAVHSLPKTEFEIVIGYTGKGWLKYLEGYNEPAVYMPIGLWRNICPYFHRLAKANRKTELRFVAFPITGQVELYDSGSCLWYGS